MSGILTEEICNKAWELLEPMIKKMADDGIIDGYGGALVVLDPTVPRHNPPVSLYEKTFGNGTQEYLDIAKSKAEIVQRTGMSSGRVQWEYPYAYGDGDTKWHGGYIDAGGLVVTFSGVQGIYDEMISEIFAAIVRALCRWEMHGDNGLMKDETSWIGDGDTLEKARFLS